MSVYHTAGLWSASMGKDSTGKLYASLFCNQEYRVYLFYIAKLIKTVIQNKKLMAT